MCPSCGLVYDGKNANKQANGRYLSRGNYYHFLLLGESQANLFERAPQNGCSANALTGDAVGKSYPAVEETSPAVEETSHAVEETSHGFPFLRLAVLPKIDAT